MRLLVVAAALAALLTYLHAVTLSYRPELVSGWAPSDTTRLPETMERAVAPAVRAVVAGEAPMPYRQRLLVPWSLWALQGAGLPFWAAWTLLTSLALALSLAGLLLASRSLGGELPAWVAALWFAVWIPAFGLSGSVAEMSASWLALGGAAFAAARLDAGRSVSAAAVLVAAAVAGLARETAVVAALAWAAASWARTRSPVRIVAAALGLAVLLLVVPRLVWRDAASARPTGLPWSNARDPRALMVAAALFLPIAPFLVRGWRAAGRCLRTYAATAAGLLLGGHVILGLLREPRLWSEPLAVAMPLLVLGLARTSSDSR